MCVIIYEVCVYLDTESSFMSTMTVKFVFEIMYSDIVWKSL